jgi:hypothetical protein
VESKYIIKTDADGNWYLTVNPNFVEKTPKKRCKHQNTLVTKNGYGANERCLDCGEEIGYV